MQNPVVIREKTQRLEVIDGGLGLHQCVLRTPNDPNPAGDMLSSVSLGWCHSRHTQRGGGEALG